MSVEVFRQLGEELERQWQAKEYALGAFPELASSLLENNDEVAAIATGDILRWITRNEELPPQQDPRSQFSDLAITFFETPRFFVSALVWLEGTTAIHQHSFSGAFRVLAGSSLHTRYSFQEEVRVSDCFRLGALNREQVELLPTGSVRPIVSGQQYIHSLFHLDRPSVTLVIRTKSDEGSKPQWSYYPPGVGYDPFARTPVARIKKLEAVSVLLTLEAEDADPELDAMLAASDLHTAFSLLSTLFHQIATNPLKRAFGAGTGQRFERLLARARQHHGPAIDLFEKVLHEQQRQEEIIGIRGYLTSPVHRFLLALLLNVPERDTVLSLIAQRCPARDPADTFVDWIDELSRTRALGSLGPNVLRIPEFDLEHRVVLRALVRGGSVADAASDLRAALPAEDGSDADHLAATIAASFRDAGALRALLRTA
jgi:hypothetical protein